MCEITTFYFEFDPMLFTTQKSDQYWVGLIFCVFTFCTNLTFKVDKEYTFSKSDILSKSKNSAFLGMKMKGRALGVVIKEKHLINE